MLLIGAVESARTDDANVHTNTHTRSCNRYPTGAVDAILGNVLEAFASAMVRALGSSRAQRLVLRPDVGLVMAGEPDAPLLSSAMSFYVPRSQSQFDGGAFLTSLKSAGECVFLSRI